MNASKPKARPLPDGYVHLNMPVRRDLRLKLRADAALNGMSMEDRLNVILDRSLSSVTLAKDATRQ